MLLDVHQMNGEVGIHRSQFLDATALEAFVVGQGADVHRDVLAKLLCHGATRVGAIAGCQKLLVLVGCCGTLLDVERVLEGNLLVWLLSVKLGNGLLQGLKVKEIERIA